MYKMRMKRRRYAKWDMTFHLHISPVSKNSYTSKSTHPKATFQPQETGKLICATLELLHICKVATKCGTPPPSKHYKNSFHLVVPCNVTEFTHLGINANRDRYTLVNNDTWKTPIQIARACRFHFYCNKNKQKNLKCTSCSTGPVIRNGMIAVGAFTFCGKTNLQRIVPSNSRQSKRAEKCQQ